LEQKKLVIFTLNTYILQSILSKFLKFIPNILILVLCKILWIDMWKQKFKIFVVSVENDSFEWSLKKKWPWEFMGWWERLSADGSLTSFSSAVRLYCWLVISPTVPCWQPRLVLVPYFRYRIPSSTRVSGTPVYCKVKQPIVGITRRSLTSCGCWKFSIFIS